MNYQNEQEHPTEEDKKYYKDWPLPCPYVEDLNWACKFSIEYLRKMAPQLQKINKKGVVVFDIDDTLIFGDPARVRNLKDMEMEPPSSNPDQDIFSLPPNTQVVQIAMEAKRLGYKIIIVTARPTTSRIASTFNLKSCQIPFDSLHMNDRDDNPFFKIHLRRSMEKADQFVVLTIGDQPFDCLLSGKGAAVKLPDPEYKCSYAYVP